MAPRSSKPQQKVTKRARTGKRKTEAAPSSTMNDTSPSSPVYFWRETEPETGYLSQWYPCAFTDDANPSIVYKTAEHYMMYHKALLFDDAAVASQILTTDHPREVRTLGRLVSNFSEETWHAHRDAIVTRANLLKFTRPADTNDGKWIVSVATRKDGQAEGKEEGEAQSLSLSVRELLLRTGERELVEASPMDRIWGIGFGAARAGSVGRERWGLNLLGKALMAVRAELRKVDEKREEGKREEKDGSDKCRFD